MVLVWIWCGFGVVLVWIWCGFGMDLVWCWCGFGVVLVWIWCGFRVVFSYILLYLRPRQPQTSKPKEQKLRCEGYNIIQINESMNQ